MLYLSSIESRALEIATEGHKGQHRWDKSPYINHPIEVANIATRLNSELKLGLRDDILRILGFTHDLAEDVKKYTNNERLVADEILEGSDRDGLDMVIVTGLYALNKHRHLNYLTFTLAAKSHPYARVVKMADLTHNLSDLTKGSMKEKYELALYILNN